MNTYIQTYLSTRIFPVYRLFLVHAYGTPIFEIKYKTIEIYTARYSMQKVFVARVIKLPLF